MDYPDQVIELLDDLRNEDNSQQIDRLADFIHNPPLDYIEDRITTMAKEPKKKIQLLKRGKSLVKAIMGK